MLCENAAEIFLDLLLFELLDLPREYPLVALELEKTLLLSSWLRHIAH